MGRIVRILLAGFVALLPLVITAMLVGWVVSILNEYVGPGSTIGQLLSSLGLSIRPASVAPYLVGLLALLIAVFLLGLLLESRIGIWTGEIVDGLMQRIPVLSSVYNLSKRFTSIVDAKDAGDLKGMSPVWCFFGGNSGAAVLALLPSPNSIKIGNEEYLGILVPSAPVPVGGALIYVPRAWVKPAEGGVDEVVSVYVSMGATPPRAPSGG